MWLWDHAGKFLEANMVHAVLTRNAAMLQGGRKV
jgi:hypothetical protein